MFDTRVRQEKSEIEFVTKSLGKVSVDRETNSFPRTGKPRREVGFIPAPLDSRRYSESTSGTAAREHCFTSGRKSRVSDDDDDDEEEEEAGETATAFHLSFLFFPPFLDRNRRRYAKVKDLPIREPVSISRENERSNLLLDDTRQFHALFCLQPPATRTGRALPFLRAQHLPRSPASIS